MTVDSARAKSIFLAASELSDPAKRAGYLDQQCGSEATLRARVEALLRAHDAAENIAIKPSGPDFAATIDTSEIVRPDAVIAGRYKLRQQIGEGGMGTVWMADQAEPVKRKVAVKLVRVERGQCKTILARFEAERQAIAMMDHPHIAKLLDAGTTETGAPYFVMELVKGIPLSDFCDQHKLTVPERLKLFTQICSAVQHAHQKGIIHRDLKPSNILVESHDGKPMPKVIDFGLAKATNSMQLTEQTMFTAFGSVIGTPLYMAPEQANFNAVDIDTRADIYALGVILYELLTGTTPITRETMKKAALDEMLKLIREQEAPTPSSRLSSVDSALSVAACRQMEPLKLGRFVRGELDWIVLKALSKDRDRRYETANGFAQDIERFLNHEPVMAGPPSARYRLQKFVQRNRGQVIAVSLVLLTLLAGIAGTTIGLFEARRQWAEAVKQEKLARTEAEAKEVARAEEAKQRATAEANEKLSEERLVQVEAEKARVETEKKRADEEKLIAESVKDFLQNKLLSQADTKAQADALLSMGRPSDWATLNPTIGELLDRAADELAPDKIESNFPNQPLVQAEILSTVGTAYLGIGGIDKARKAIDLFKRSVDSFRLHHGPDHPDTLKNIGNMALAHQAAGQMNKALPLYEETLKLIKIKLGPEHSETLLAMNNLATGYTDDGQFDMALPLYEETLRLRKAKYGRDHQATLTSMNNLARCYMDAGQLNKALPLYEETFLLQKSKLGSDHPDTLTSMHNLAGAYKHANQLHKAMPLYEETLKLRKVKLGLDHPATLTTMSNLAMGYYAAGKRVEAQSLQEETLRLRKIELGPDHPHTLISMNNLAEIYSNTNQLAKALPLYEETLKNRQAILGPGHPSTLTTMNNLARSYSAANQPDRALLMFEETLKLMVVKLGPEHPTTLVTLNNLAGAYFDAGRLDKALPIFENALSQFKATLGLEHPDTLNSMDSLATCYWSSKQLDKSVPLFEELLPLLEKKYRRTHPYTLKAVANLGVNYKDAGRLAEAIPLLEEAYRASKTNPALRWIGTPLLDAYSKAGKPAEARKLIDEILTDSRKTLPEGSPQLAGMMAQFGLSMLEMKEYTDAETLLRECLAIREKTQLDDWRTFNTYSLFGAALLGQQNYADAEPLLLKGYEGMRAREAMIPQQGKVRLPEALDRLIELYTATDKPDEVKEWQAERAKYPPIEFTEKK